MNYKVLIAAALAATVVQAGTVEENLPEGWFKNGQSPAVDNCQAGIDADLAGSGVGNVTLKCETNDPGFVSFMQQFSAEAYRGNRVRYSAVIKAEGVEGWGGLWMRVDADNESIAFDNMQSRPIKGTADWQRYEVVLDVAPNAEVMSIGMLMVEGRGQLWVRDMWLDVVGLDLPVTQGGRRTLPYEPANLSLTP